MTAMSQPVRRASPIPAEAVPASRGGRPALISPARILEEARHIPARELTMPMIARRLGVNPAALYYHFESRDALLTALCEQLVTEFALRAPDPRHWRRWMHGTAAELLRFLSANRVILEVGDWSRLPVLSLRLVESVLETLTRAGFSKEEALRMWSVIAHFVYGSARAVHDAQAPPPAQTREQHVTAVLAGIGPEFPLTRAALAAWPKRDPLAVLDEMLEWLIDTLPNPRRAARSRSSTRRSKA